MDANIFGRTLVHYDCESCWLLLAHFINSSGERFHATTSCNLAHAKPIRPSLHLPTDWARPGGRQGQDRKDGDPTYPFGWAPRPRLRSGSECCPPDDAAFLAGVSGGPASAGRFFSPSNDFMQRLHATISCNDTNIGHDTKISGHQARCILY